MVRHDLIKKLEELDYFSELLTSGIIPMKLIDYKVIYEYYLIEKEKVKGKQLVTNVAEEFNISERSVYVIVQTMKA